MISCSSCITVVVFLHYNLQPLRPTVPAVAAAGPLQTSQLQLLYTAPAELPGVENQFPAARAAPAAAAVLAESGRGAAAELVGVSPRCESVQRARGHGGAIAIA